jgi:hypothetical protein
MAKNIRNASIINATIYENAEKLNAIYMILGVLLYKVSASSNPKNDKPNVSSTIPFFISQHLTNGYSIQVAVLWFEGSVADYYIKLETFTRRTSTERF